MITTITVTLYGGPNDGQEVPTSEDTNEIFVDGHLYRFDIIRTAETGKDIFTSETIDLI